MFGTRGDTQPFMAVGVVIGEADGCEARVCSSKLHPFTI